MFFSNPNCRSETPHNLSLLESIELYSFWDAVDSENWDIKNIETFLLKRFDVFLRRDIREKGKASKPTHHDSSISTRSLTYRSLDYRRKNTKYKFDQTRTYVDNPIDWSDRSAISNMMLPLTPHEHIKHAYDISINFTQHSSQLPVKCFIPTFRNLKYWFFLMIYHSDFIKNDYDIFMIGHLYSILDRWHIINRSNFSFSRDKKFLDEWLSSHPWESDEDMKQYVLNINAGTLEQLPANWSPWDKDNPFLLPSQYPNPKSSKLESDSEEIQDELSYISTMKESSKSNKFICESCGHHNNGSAQNYELSLNLPNIDIDPPFYEEDFIQDNDVSKKYIPGEGWVNS